MANNKNSLPPKIPILAFALSIAALLTFLTPGSLKQNTPARPSGGAISCLGYVPNVAQAAQNIRLCGRLVFVIEDVSHTNYLGLIPCPDTGGGKPYIFRTRPRYLYNYYQLLNPVIKKGPPLQTNFGRVDEYIDTFDEYLPLKDCSECLANVYGTPTTFVVEVPTSAATFDFPTATKPVTPSATATITNLPTQTFTATAPPTLTATQLPPSPATAPPTRLAEAPQPTLPATIPPDAPLDIQQGMWLPLLLAAGATVLVLGLLFGVASLKKRR